MSPTVREPRPLTLLDDAWRDWQPMEALLSWLERLRALLDGTGGMTAEDQALINPLARALLLAAAGTLDRAVPVPPSPVAREGSGANGSTPSPAAVQTPASRNGHRASPVKQWSLNERLSELGYPEDLDRGPRIKLGQAVVDAYRQARGKAPAVADYGRGAQAKHVSLYEEADFLLVDGVVWEMLGEPPGVEALDAVAV